MPPRRGACTHGSWPCPKSEGSSDGRPAGVSVATGSTHSSAAGSSGTRREHHLTEMRRDIQTVTDKGERDNDRSWRNGTLFELCRPTEPALSCKDQA